MGELSDFKVRDFVEWLPHTDLFMRGERYGTVTYVGRKYIHVLGQRSGKRWIVGPDQLQLVERESS